MYRLIERSAPGASALAEILDGLSRQPRQVPAKYFYDEAGSALFDRICELPEYYLTRAELQLMERHRADIARFIGADCELIEFGCGSGRKTRLLVEALKPLAFIPIDISKRALECACEELSRAFPAMRLTALHADYTQPIAYPSDDDLPIRRRAVYFPGSTVGNFDRDETLAFLRHVRELVGPGGALVIGVDRKKSPKILHAAYNDAAGVTAAFNLNLLAHLNRVFGADFDLEAFGHLAFYDERLGRIEMYLRSERPQVVRLGDRKFEFACGELMRTEISCKYSIEEFQQMGRDCGFAAERVWLDDAGLFAVHGMLAGG